MVCLNVALHCSAGGRAAAPQAGGAPSLLEIQQEQARQLELKREQEVQQQKQKPKVSARIGIFCL